MANLSKIKLNGTNYDLKDSKARVIYIDIVPGEDDNFVTSDNLTYSDLKAMTEQKDNIICLRYNEQRWYLLNSETAISVLVDEAIVDEAVLEV